MKRNYNFYTDKFLKITFWGKGISSFTGIKPADAIGKKYYKVMKKICFGSTDALTSVIKDDKTIVFKDYPLSSVAGETRADIIISTAKDSNGKIQGVKVKVSHNPSQTYAEDLKSFSDFLETAFQVHGLRGPLNTIKGAAQFLKDSRPEDMEIKEFVTLIEEAVNQMDNTVSKFLSLPIKKLALSDVDINALLKKIKSLTSQRLIQHGIKAFYSYGDIPNVKVDHLQIHQAVMNVIDNAIEAMTGSGELKICSSSEHFKQGDFVVISVSDTGPGIKSAMTTNRIKNSRGFGLTLTRLILHCHGGWMKISDDKTGTTVKLYLPVKKEGE